MMPRCLESDVLERFARGELSGESDAKAETHIATCRRCARKLASLPVDEKLLEQIRDADRSRREIAPALSTLNAITERLTTTLFHAPPPGFV